MGFDYDLFVIGAGSGGLAASKRAANYGAKVAIAEADLVGGTCVIRGCIPKKLMVYAADFAHYQQASVGYGWQDVQPAHNWQQMTQAINQEVLRLSARHTANLEKNGIELIHGHAHFLDPHTLKVGDRQITADKILIAVGGEAIPSWTPGGEHALTSRHMFHLQEQPRHLAVVGGGYIGVEFAGILRGLGSKVTQIIRRDLILRGFDQDLRTEIQAGMTHRGIEFLTETTVEKIEPGADGLTLTLAGQEAGKTLTVDAVLWATGRAPLLADLGLDQAGVAVENQAIAVNEYSCTSQPHIFAVGDCTDRNNLTPVAIAEGRAFADTEFGQTPRCVSHSNIPSAIFARPEGATVGLTEEEARGQMGEDIICYRARFRSTFYSLTDIQEKVVVKLVVDSRTDRVLGAHMVGEHAAEIIQSLAVAVNMGATKKDFDATMALHPSVAEEFVTLR